VKLSYAVSFQKTGFKFIAQGDWVSKAKILASLGYDGIELSIRNPEEKNIARDIEKALHRYNLKLSAIGTGQMLIDDGLSLSSLKQDIRNRAIGRIKKHIDLAKRFDTQVIVGLARGGRINLSQPLAQYRKNLKDSFKKLLSYIDKQKVIITVEAVNRYETSFLSRIDEVLDFIAEFNCQFIRILADTFHMNIEESNLRDSIIKAKKYLSYVHLADSNRLCPGMGHIDFKEVIATLRKIGYKDYLSAEILHSTDFKTSAKKFSNHIRRLL